MARCQRRTGAATYQELAELALGRRAGTCIEFFFYLELAGSLVGYCISIGDNLARAFPGG
jgi:amino acid permease